MASQGRIKTKYPGIYYAMSKSATGKAIKRFSVVFKRDGKVFEEAAKVLIDDGPETRPAETVQEANAWRSRRIEEVTQKKDESRARLTVNEIWELWRDGKNGRGMAATSSRYKHVKRAFGNHIVEDLCSFDVARFRRDMETSGFSACTIKLCMALLSTLIRWAARSRLVRDPGLVFEFPALDNQKTEQMTPEQMVEYWKVLDGWHDQEVADYFRLMLLTGIRRRALAALKWTDVDLSMGFLTLRGDTAKNKRTRLIPLPAAAIKIFKAMPQNGDQYVWSDGRGGFRDVGRLGPALRDAAGLPEDFRPCHGLRHTFASALASSGKVDIFTLQQLLTHSSPIMTQRYSHLSSEALRRAASVTDDVMTPSRTLKVVAGKE